MVAHGVAVRPEVGGFEHHVVQARGGLDGLQTTCRRLRATPNTAGTAHATCLPCFRTSIAVAGVARRVGGDEDGLDAVVFDQSPPATDRSFSQRQALANAAHRSGNRSLTAATVTFGWSWKLKAAPNSAGSVADDPHADLAIRDWLSTHWLASVRSGLSSKPRNRLLLGEGSSCQPQSSSAERRQFAKKIVVRWNFA